MNQNFQRKVAGKGSATKTKQKRDLQHFNIFTRISRRSICFRKENLLGDNDCATSKAYPKTMEANKHLSDQKIKGARSMLEEQAVN